MRRSHNRKLGALGTSHAEGDAGCSGEAGQDHECDRPDGTVTVRFWQLCDHNRHAAPGQTPARCCRGSRDEGEANVAIEHLITFGRRVPQEGDRGEEVVFERIVADARDRVRDRHAGKSVGFERRVADARDRVSDRHGGQGVVGERKVTDARDRVRDRHAGEGVAIERIVADARDRAPDGHAGEGIVVERARANARDRVRDRHAGEGVAIERIVADARDRVRDRHAGEGVAIERIVADARDRVAIKGGRDDEGCWAGTGAASDGGNAARDGVLKATRGECPRTARYSEADNEPQGQNGWNDSLGGHQVLHAPDPYPRAAGAYLHDPLAGGVLRQPYPKHGLPNRG